MSKILLPVYYIRVTFNTKPKNDFSLLKKLEKKYKNFKLIYLPARVLFKNTIFEKTYNETGIHFPLLVKVLISWNFGGIVIDSKLIAIKPYGDDLLRNNNAVIGISKGEIVLIDTKRYCHSYIFELMKVLAESGLVDLSEDEMAEIALKRFNNDRGGHNGVDLISDPDWICTSETKTDNCTFLNSKYCNSKWLEGFCTGFK